MISVLDYFAASIVIIASLLFAFLLVLFRKDHYKLAVSLSLEIASFAVVLLGGKDLVFDFAARLSDLRLSVSYNDAIGAGWEYVTVIAIMAAVTIVALIMKGMIDYAMALRQPVAGPALDNQPSNVQ